MRNVVGERGQGAYRVSQSRVLQDDHATLATEVCSRSDRHRVAFVRRPHVTQLLGPDDVVYERFQIRAGHAGVEAEAMAQRSSDKCAGLDH